MNSRSVITMTAIFVTLVACTTGSDEHGERERGGSNVPSSGHSTTSPDASAEAGAAASALTDVAFVDGAGGPRILVAGTDPNENLESVQLQLLGPDAQPAIIDPDGDGVAEPPELELFLTPADRHDGTFFLEVLGSSGLGRFVQSVIATAQDRRGSRGKPLSASLGQLPIRKPGERCDPRGFDACAESLACVAAGEGATCVDGDQARADRCAGAPLVMPGARIVGNTSGTSLWDPIDGCASAERRTRPEAVVRLHLPSNAASLTIVTTPEKTDFDTVVSILEGCGPSRETKVLACNDDDPPPTSRVSLTNVAAGDYFIVIDSLDRRGGQFELMVTAH